MVETALSRVPLSLFSLQCCIYIFQKPSSCQVYYLPVLNCLFLLFGQEICLTMYLLRAEERLSLDMSVMMAVDSSDEENVKSKPRKARPAERSGQKRNGKLLCVSGKDKGKPVGGKENEPRRTSSIAKTEKKRRANERQQPGKKPKKMSTFYEDFFPTGTSVYCIFMDNVDNFAQLRDGWLW